jgi:hypothetical protein
MRQIGDSIALMFNSNPDFVMPPAHIHEMEFFV